MRNKLSIKLILIIVISVALLAGIFAPVYFMMQQRIYISSEKARVAEFSEKLAATEPFTKDSLESFYNESNVNFRVYVFDEECEPLFASFQMGYSKKFVTNVYENRKEHFQENIEPDYFQLEDEPAVWMYTFCEKDGKTYYIIVKDSLIGVNDIFDFSNKILGYVVAGYVLICSIVLYLAISRTVRSIKEVTDVAKNISQNNLSVRYQGKMRRDEIGELAKSVNTMADTIQDNITNLENYNFLLREDNNYMKEYEESRRRLLRNVTHDLKTPLAVISSQVEMLSICEEQEKKDYYYQSAMEEISKLSKMISDVLQMTVEERSLTGKEAQELNISEQIASLCDSRRAYIRSRDLKLITDIEPDLRITTVKQYVEYVFKNYLSNAVQNAYDRSAITVALKSLPGRIRFSIENIGSSIPDELKDKIWTEAFTTSPEGAESTGLGLYIVKEISLIEHTECGFDNTETGVRFWFDFIDSSIEGEKAE